jgi:hypothetical protein
VVQGCRGDHRVLRSACSWQIPTGITPRSISFGREVLLPNPPHHAHSMPHGTTGKRGAISSRRIGGLPRLCRTFVHDAPFRSISSSRFSRSVGACARQSEAKRLNYPANIDPDDISAKRAFHKALSTRDTDPRPFWCSSLAFTRSRDATSAASIMSSDATALVLATVGAADCR